MTLINSLVGVAKTPEAAAIHAKELPTSAPSRLVATGLTATGTVIGDALQLTAFASVISTAAASTGVKLPSTWPIGAWGHVQNNGANAMNLFPPTASIAINGGTLGAAVTIAAAAGNIIIRLSATDFQAYVVAKEA